MEQRLKETFVQMEIIVQATMMESVEQLQMKMNTDLQKKLEMKKVNIILHTNERSIKGLPPWIPLKS